MNKERLPLLLFGLLAAAFFALKPFVPVGTAEFTCLILVILSISLSLVQGTKVYPLLLCALLLNLLFWYETKGSYFELILTTLFLAATFLSVRITIKKQSLNQRALLEFVQYVNEASDRDDACLRAAECIQRWTPYKKPTILLAEPGETGTELVVHAGVFDGLVRVPPGKGITGRAFRLGMTMVVTDASEDPDYVPGLSGAVSELSVPLKWKDQCFGVLDIETTKKTRFSEGDIHTVELFGSVLAETLHHLETREQLQQLLERSRKQETELERLLRSQHTLFEIILAVEESAEKTEEVFSLIAHLAASRLNFSNVCIYSADFEKNTFVEKTFSGVPVPHEDLRPCFEHGAGIIGHVIQTGKGYVCSDIQNDPHWMETASYANSLLVVPIKGASALWGLIVARDARKAAFNENDLQLMTILGNYLAIRLEREKTFRELEMELERMRILHQFIQEVGTIREIQEISHVLVNLITQKLGYAMVELFEVESESEDGEVSLKLLASPNISPEDLPEINKQLKAAGSSLVKRSAKTRRLQNTEVHVQGSEGDPVTGFRPLTLEDLEIRYQLDVPVMLNERYFGVLSIGSKNRPFSHQDEELFVILAKHLAVIWANRELMSMLELQAMQDYLTGLWNRRYLQVRLPEEQARVQRSREPLSIVMIDLFNFKEVNDRFGHGAGDRLLASVARCLKKATRSSDILFRYGGDEFLILMPGANASGGREVMERIEALLRQTQGLEETTIDFGIASFPQDSEDLDELCRIADKRMYEAKKRHHERAERFSEFFNFEKFE